MVQLHAVVWGCLGQDTPRSRAERKEVYLPKVGFLVSATPYPTNPLQNLRLCPSCLQGFTGGHRTVMAGHS
jgi:hypothetical protein